jgi:hypothetical protein
MRCALCFTPSPAERTIALACPVAKVVGAKRITLLTSRTSDWTDQSAGGRHVRGVDAIERDRPLAWLEGTAFRKSLVALSEWWHISPQPQ